MSQFKRQQTKRTEYLYLGLKGLGTFALMLVAIMTLRGAWGMYGKLAEATDGQEKAQAQLASLQAQKAKVSAAVAELDSSRGVEAEVRQRYGVAKPGEGEIQIVPVAATEATTTPVVHGFWSNMWHALWVW
jgi:cell division protein FtsB